MSEKEREKVDEKTLLRLMRNGMLALAGCMAAGMIGLLTVIRLLLPGSIALLLLMIVVSVVRANTGTKK